MIYFLHQFILFSMLMIMLAGLAWDHLWSQVPCPDLKGSSRYDKTWYQSSRFKSPRMFEKAALSRVLLMGVKCTTSNVREAIKCFRKNFTFLLLLSCIRYDLIPFQLNVERLRSGLVVELRHGMLMHVMLTQFLQYQIRKFKCRISETHFSFWL